MSDMSHANNPCSAAENGELTEFCDERRRFAPLVSGSKPLFYERNSGGRLPKARRSRKCPGAFDYPPAMSAMANDIRRLMEAGRTADAEASLRRKLTEAPTNAEWRALLARVLVATGRKPEAIAELGIAVEHAPGTRETRLTLARLANELGQSDLAARHARILTERDARDSEAWSALGMAAFGLRNKREATRALRRAVEIAPAYGAARYNLAAVLADQERSEEALEHAAAALKHGARPRSVSLVQIR